MASTTERREKISTRIEREARAQRSTPAKVARDLLEDAARRKYAEAAQQQERAA